MMRRSSLFGQLKRDVRGVSAIEFAMIAPVVIAFYMGATEFCQAFMAQKRMGHVAFQVADMLAQQERVDTAGIDGLFDVSSLTMKPFSTTPLKLRVSSVEMGADGVARIAWSRGDGLAARTVGDTVTPPSNVMVAGQSVIMSEAEYNYDSPVDYLMSGVTKFDQTYWLRPRLTDRVTCSDC
jgi:TadE-like protein.